MQKDSKLFDDIAKIASGAAGSVLEMKREMEQMVSLQLEKLLQKMDLATKEEYATLQAMLLKLRSENEDLKQRVKALENARKE
jgi:BMFP domain-containing protein YqiC